MPIEPTGLYRNALVFDYRVTLNKIKCVFTHPLRRKGKSRTFNVYSQFCVEQVNDTELAIVKYIDVEAFLEEISSSENFGSCYWESQESGVHDTYAPRQTSTWVLQIGLEPRVK